MPLYLYTKVLDDSDIRFRIDRDNGDTGSVEIAYEIRSLRERLHEGNFPSCFGENLTYTVECLRLDPILIDRGTQTGLRVHLLLEIARSCTVYLFGYLTVTQHSADGILEPEEDYFGLEGPAITSILMDGNLCLMEYAGSHPFRDKF